MEPSIVIPAFNEENYLLRTLVAIRSALADMPDVELLVSDNASTDQTREIALRFGARVVDEAVHNIGQVRNTGAAAAGGESIVFVDADTTVRPGVFEKITNAMQDKNCVGGSVAVEYEGELRRVWVRWFMKLWPFLGKLLRMRQGALQFCRKDVFIELGGYDTTIYVGEDIEFHWRLDKLARQSGRYTTFIEEPRVLTSSRRWDRMGLVRMLLFTHPITIFLGWRVRGLWRDWYEDAIR